MASGQHLGNDAHERHNCLNHTGDRILCSALPKLGRIDAWCFAALFFAPTLVFQVEGGLDILVRKFRYELLHVAARFRRQLLHCRLQPLPHQWDRSIHRGTSKPLHGVPAGTGAFPPEAVPGSGLSPRASLLCLPAAFRRLLRAGSLCGPM